MDLALTLFSFFNGIIDVLISSDRRFHWKSLEKSTHNEIQLSGHGRPSHNL
ncbi:unnamed protein product, partial [Larinioides sclopetarius]